MSDPPIRQYAIALCDACIRGDGGECHSPGCALWCHRAPDTPIIVADHYTCEPLEGVLSRERSSANVEVPDVWICKSCGLELIERAFDPDTGEVGCARLQPMPECPNGHGDSMRRQTWKERCLETETRFEAASAEVHALYLGIESLVRDEIISASRAREVHGLSPEQQRELWRRMERLPR